MEDTAELLSQSTFLYLKLKKTSEDGVVKGIKFKVTGTDYSKTATTDENGTFTLTDLVPGNYTVAEITDSKYETQKSQTLRSKAERLQR